MQRMLDWLRLTSFFGLFQGGIDRTGLDEIKRSLEMCDALEGQNESEEDEDATEPAQLNLAIDKLLLLNPLKDGVKLSSRCRLQDEA